MPLALQADFKVKENLDVFCIDEEQSRIIIASSNKIKIFSLSPVLKVQTTMIPNLGTGLLHSVCIKPDRFAALNENEVICFSLSGQEIFRYQIPGVKINCVTFDPLNNLYVHSANEGCSYKKYAWCSNCGVLFNLDKYGYCQSCCSQLCVNKRRREVYQIILSDGGNVCLFISDCMNASFLFFNGYSEHLVLSDGIKCTEYKLNI